jgi:type I restriction enzyme S subunit
LLSVYRDYGVIRKSDRDDNFNNASDDLSTYQLVEPGDLAMNKMKAWQGSLGISSHRGIVSPAYFVFSPRREFHPPFLHYLLRSPPYAAGYMTISKGIRINQWDVDPDHLSSLPVMFPSLDEQAAIAALLDRETAKIDALVAEQERLIALLKEKRQAVISHAVTKGLTPHAPMKDSGIEWLGEIPAHWEVGPLKRYTASLDGRRVPLSAEERGAMQGEYPYYGASGIIDHVDDYIFDEPLVLVSEDGANLLMRNYRIAFVATGKYWVNNHAHILRPNDGLVSFWADRIEAIDLTPVITGAAQPKLTADALEKLRVAVPREVHERQEIEAHVEKTTAAFAPLINEAQAAITLLQERRAALISAAVTGKIDVRGLVDQQELEAA